MCVACVHEFAAPEPTRRATRARGAIARAELRTRAIPPGPRGSARDRTRTRGVHAPYYAPCPHRLQLPRRAHTRRTPPRLSDCTDPHRQRRALDRPAPQTFGTGNLVVVRVGDSAYNARTATLGYPLPTYVDEYNSATGVLVQTVNATQSLCMLATGKSAAAAPYTWYDTEGECRATWRLVSGGTGAWGRERTMVVSETARGRAASHDHLAFCCPPPQVSLSSATTGRCASQRCGTWALPGGQVGDCALRAGMLSSDALPTATPRQEGGG